MTNLPALHWLRLGLRNIAAHRLRSCLTVSGIILGVASVIIMLSVGEGAKHEAIQQIQQLGATNLILRSSKPLEQRKEESQRLLLTYGLTFADLERITTTVPTIVGATPIREFRREFQYGERKIEGRIVAATPNYLEHNGLTIARGRFLVDRDNIEFTNVAVLGAETAAVLFPIADPVGKSLKIGDFSYTIIGVTEQRAQSAGIGSSLSAQDYNRDVYIPFETDRIRNGPILVSFRAGTIEAEKLQISQITVAVDTLENVKPTAEILQGLLDRFHPKKDVTITVPLDLLEKAEQTQRLFTLVLGAIASISLLVGGIGIMNIMLATVTERTREVGIRRALGAKRRDIIWQFLVETMVLSSLGGLLGVGLGLATTYGVTYFFGLKTIVQSWSPFLAFSVSVGLGLVFGIYPARRAAYMDPIEALRHE
jgi:putative ABC transport system permease protein